MTVLALVTLANETQIGLGMFVSWSPKVASKALHQLTQAISLIYIGEVFGKNTSDSVP
jgi:hypothetical protein